MKAEPQAVEIGSGTEHAVMPEHAHRIGQRIRRIGNGEHLRFRCHGVQFGDYVLVDFDIGGEQPQAAGRVIAVGGTAGLFVGAGSDHHQRGAIEIGVITVRCFDGGR